MFFQFEKFHFRGDNVRFSWKMAFSKNFTSAPIMYVFSVSEIFRTFHLKCCEASNTNGLRNNVRFFENVHYAETYISK